jgi:hypothetical protein
MRDFLRTSVVVLALLGSAQPAGAVDFLSVIPGPVEAEVGRVIDGDSFVARVFYWPR